MLNQATVEDAIQKLDGVNLDVLPVRKIPENPSELLASEDMRKLVEGIADRYDRIILDTPACLGLPDAKTVSEICDGLVMVVVSDLEAWLAPPSSTLHRRVEDPASSSPILC